MRGFRKKIEWQNRFLEEINSRLPAERQLSGLAGKTIERWKSENDGSVSKTLCDIAEQAAIFSDSVNDFSAPVEMPLKEAEKNLKKIYEELVTYNSETFS